MADQAFNANFWRVMALRYFRALAARQLRKAWGATHQHGVSL